MLLVALLLLCALEGLASFALAWRNPPGRAGVAERLHTEHDPLLGWINKPDQLIPHMYGPGRHLRTNSQRLRSGYDFEPEVPPGRARWVCTGDSFTFGYGVADEEAWCALLGERLPGVEPVNMGQGGYGIDQAYLWYSRDGGRLEHQVLLFAFVTIDRDRMRDCRFLGYPKPCLAVREGRLVQRNVPVPLPDEPAPPPSRVRRMLQSSRLGWLVRRSLEKASLRVQQNRLHELTAAVLDRLDELTRERGAALVLVHLPMETDYDRPVSRAFRSFLGSLASERGWPYLDLVAELRRLPPERVPDLFIQQNLPGFVAARGHYTEAGNRFIADRIVEQMRSHPRLLPETPASDPANAHAAGATP